MPIVMRRRLLFYFRWVAVALVLSALGAVSRAEADTGFLNRTVQVGSNAYRFQVYVPAAWDAQRSWPVLLFLHGSGERGDDGLLPTQVGIGTAIRRHAANFPILVVMPQCRPDKLWNDADMIAQALAALEQVVQEFHGDRTRLYLTGLSIGGYGTWEIGASHPGLFAAIAPVCGGISAPPDYAALHSSLLNDPTIKDAYAETARRIGTTPVWIFHGGADGSVPVEESRKMAQALRDAKANVQFTEYPGVGHNSWDSAYAEDEFVPWLLAQHLAAK